VTDNHHDDAEVGSGDGAGQSLGWIGRASADPLVVQLPIGIAVYDAGGRLVLGNAAYERHFGVRVADVPRSYSLFDDPQLEGAGLLPLIRQAYAGDTILLPPVRYDAARASGGPGRTIWTQGHCFPIREDSSGITHVAILHLDVTTWSDTEAALRQSGVELEERNVQLEDQAVELELTNQQLQDQAAELELQSEELEAATEELAKRTLVAEAAEALLQAAFAQAPAAVAVTTGPDHRFELSNARYAALVGRTVRLGQSFAEALPEISDQGYTALLDRVFATGEAYAAHESHAWVQKGGPEPEEGWYDFVYQPLTDASGRVTGIMQLGIDVTDQVRARQSVEALNRELRESNVALIASEAKYRALFESLEAGFCIVEMLFDDTRRAIDYRFVEANPAFERQTGLVNAIGRTALELVPDLEMSWFERYGHVATTGEPTRFELGSEPMGRWFDVFAFRVGSPSEARVAIFFNDVSAARAAEAERDDLLSALEVERSRLAYVFQHAPAFLAVLRGPSYVFELVNDAYYQLVGHRELLGKPVWEALPEVRGQGFEALLDGVVTTGEPFLGREVPLRVARTPGASPEERYVDLAYLALIEADGSRGGIIAHGTDVTESVLSRREVERLLAESERARADAESARGEAEAARVAAEAANRAKAEFLATMSHELRTPLNAIGGYTELLELGIRGPVTDEQRADLARIQHSQRHLLGLVNEVLDLSKLDAGALRIETARVRSGDTVDAALALVRPQAAAKALSLSEACRGTGDTSYLGDEPRVRQVLVNLLANAVKFTDVGGSVTVECVVTDTPPASAKLIAGAPYVALRVVDNGRGIPASQLERIFEPFTQAAGTGPSPYTRHAGGTGLGLAISRRLARLMNGDLTVESQEGAGSVFTLWLPAVERRTTPRLSRAVATELRTSSTGDVDSGDIAGGLARIGVALTAEVPAIIHAWVARLRSEADIPSSAAPGERPFTDAELEDHAATFVTDVGLALRTFGDGAAAPEGNIRDGTAILALISERHGAQRSRLGWPEAAVAREFGLLAETVSAAVERFAQAENAEVAQRATGLVARLLAQAERISLGGYRVASAPTARA
jgi:signal transduction histidine kinase